MHRVSLGSINVRTCKDRLKLEQVVLASDQLAHDLCFVSETRMATTFEVQLLDDFRELPGWRFIYSGLKKAAAAGVGLILSPNVQLIEYDSVLRSRILRARITLHGIKLVVFSIYAPQDTIGEGDAAKTRFYCTLKKALADTRRSYPGHRILCAGDFNATIGKQSATTKFVGGNFDQYATTNNGERLCDLANAEGLYLCNTIFQAKKRHTSTWRSADKRTLKRLDYFACDEWLWKCATQCRAYTAAVSDVYESDHKLLTLFLRLPSKVQRRAIFQKRAPKPKPRVAELRRSAELRKAYSEELDRTLPAVSAECTAAEAERTIATAVKNAIAKTCPHGPASKDPDWYSPELKDVILELMGEKDRVKRAKIAKRLRALRAKLKLEFYQKRSVEMCSAAKLREDKELYRLAREVRLVKPRTANLCPPEKLREYMSGHFSCPEVEIPQEIQSEDFASIFEPQDPAPSVVDSCPSLQEVRDAILTLKNGKAIGTDGLIAEFLKYAESDLLVQWIHTMIRIIWEGGEVPETWRISRIVCLWKCKGKQIDPSKYRGLSVNALLNKLTMAIGLDRLRPRYEAILLNSQYGFRSGVGTIDGIYVCKKVLELAKTPVRAVFVDLRAAFDKICRTLLFTILRFRLGDNTILDIVERIYSRTGGYISGTKPSDTFAILSGVRQGAVESPLLFNTIMDTVIRVALHELRSDDELGIEIEYHIAQECSTREMRSTAPTHGKLKISVILYADDLVIFCTSADGLQRALTKFEDTFTRFGMIVARDKTKTMCFGEKDVGSDIDSFVQLGGEPVENVNAFKYLGHLITSDPKIDNIGHKIGSAWESWANYKHVFLDQEIPLSIRVKILESTVRSRLVYALQYKLLTAKESSRINTIWMGFLRKMVRGGYARKSKTPEEDQSWALKFTNAKILELCRTPDIACFCEKQHYKFIAHTCRRQNSELQKVLCFAQPRKGQSQHWVRLGKSSQLDPMQLRKTMFDRKSFNKWLSDMFE